MKKLILIFISVLFSSSLFASWVPLPSISGGTDNIIYKLLNDGRGNLFASIRTGGIYKSTNAGQTWSQSGIAGGSVYCLTLAPNGDIYGIGRAGSNEIIYRSTDDGLSWQIVYSRSFSQNVSLWGSIVFPQTGPMVAAFSVTVYPTVSDVDVYMLRSTNSGTTWNELGFVSPLIQTATGGGSGMVAASDGNIILGTGQAGIIKTSTFGSSWSGVSSFNSMFSSTLLKANDNSIVAGAAYGVSRSTDNLSSFNFLGPFNAWAYTNTAAISPQDQVFIEIADGRLYFTSGFDTWTEDHVGLPYGFHSDCFEFIDGKVLMTGHAPGSYNGKIFIFNTVTGISNENGIIKEYQLKQNFPNPFNPSTNISYNLPVSGNVHLKVFDALGNTIDELVNERQIAGNHSVTFNASALSSGIYFYKLESGSFFATRKMLLIK